MSHFAGLRRILRIHRPEDAGKTVDEELRFHFQMTVEELLEAGMDPAAARAEAERRFGDFDATREGLKALDRARTSRQRRGEWWGGVVQDLRYATRGLRLRPGFAAAVILTLGLGIGANATMFGIVDRLLLRPPAYLARPADVHLSYFAATYDGVERFQLHTSVPALRDVRRWTRSFDEIAGVSTMSWAVGSGEDAQELPVMSASAGFWRLFDARPALGRFFDAEEDSLPERSRVVVLGYGYWQSHFGSRRDVVGEELRLGRNVYTIIGVAPPAFAGLGLELPAAFIPLTAAAYGEAFGDGDRVATSYGYHWLLVVARRHPGVGLEAATADLTSAYQRSYEARRVEQPGMRPAEEARPHAVLGPVQRAGGPNGSDTARISLWLLGVAAVVLLIACANVGNLLLARTLGRRREIAVRLALGVSRARLLRQVLVESLLLALLGGVSGILLAQFGGGILGATLLKDVAWSSALTDGRILGLTVALALGAGLLTGVVPAWQAGRSDVAKDLKAGVREGTYHRSRFRTGMLVLQVGLSVVLLVGAGLFVRSLQRALSSPLGFDPEHVLYVELQMREVALDSVAGLQLRERLLAAASALPEVEHASRQVSVPFWQTWDEDLYVAGIDSVRKLGDFEIQGGTPDYFATMGTALIRGRGITASDRQGTELVMVASQSMAERLWPSDEAIGKCVRVGADTAPCTYVVGIAQDIKTGSLSEPTPVYYRPVDQIAPESGGLFVRVRGSAAAAAEGVRRALTPVMPGAAYLNVTPLDEVLGQERRAFALGATMFSVFGGLALLLAAVGLYSVISYGVLQRRHELGVRVALGAQVQDILGMVVGEGMRLTAFAVGLGLLLAWAAGRWVAPLLFETSPHDARIFGGVALALLLIALVATLIPARRAARVDPNTALRAD